MFIGSKTQYCQDTNFSQLDLLNQCNPKILASYSEDIDKVILKFMWKCERLKIANIILKENKVGRLTLPDLKTYCSVILAKE